MIRVSPHAQGATFAVKVVPGASRERIVGALGEALKVAVAKPPSGGEANRAVIAVLSKSLAISEKQIEIVSGHSSPRKQILVSGIDVPSLAKRLQELCE